MNEIAYVIADQLAQGVENPPSLNIERFRVSGKKPWGRGVVDYQWSLINKGSISNIQTVTKKTIHSENHSFANLFRINSISFVHIS